MPLRKVIAPAAIVPPAFVRAPRASAGMCVLHNGVVESRATSVTVLSFSRSYTSPTGRVPPGVAAATMMCRPPTPIRTGPDVVSKTVRRASSPDAFSDRSGGVKYATPPYDVDVK